MKTPSLYTTYCLIILISFITATYQGYAISSFFSNQQKASKTVTRYHK